MPALLLLLALVAAAPDTAGIGFDSRLGAALPMTAPLRAENGGTVSLGDAVGGVPLVLALGYFNCPNLCGVVREDALAALAASGLRAGRDYRLVVLGIDPDEGPADAARAKEGALDRYPDAGGTTGWRFLTAPAASIAAVTDAVGFRSRFDPAQKQFLHPAGLVVATPSGVVSSYLLGVGYSPGELRSDVLRAGQGAVAEAVSPVLLLCFHYDPQTGRYSLAIYRALSVMAALTAATVAGGLFLAHWHDRGGRA